VDFKNMEARSLMVAPMIVMVCRCCGPLNRDQVRIGGRPSAPKFYCKACRNRQEKDRRRRISLRMQQVPKPFVCKICGPLSDDQVRFHKRKGRKKISRRCKACCARYQKDYQEKNKQNKIVRVVKKMLGPYLCKNCGPLSDDKLITYFVKSRASMTRKCLHCTRKYMAVYNLKRVAKRKAKREEKNDC
jgi:hypothetical protein